MTITINDIIILINVLFLSILLYNVLNKIIIPKIIDYSIKEIDRNPKWVTSRLQYYGFDDIDIVLCECPFHRLPRFRIIKTDKLELLIDNDTSVNDIEELGRIALITKIKVKYGLWFPEKPIHWLSVMCYMLDGGDIQMTNIASNNK